MAGFPDDLIDEILLRTPVEALLRFRCVSKRWRNLIDSPNFVKSQLNLPNKPQSVMMVVFHEKLRIYYSKLNPSPNFKELPIPLSEEILPNVFNDVSHCNGLLCCICWENRSFIVLNPFTGKHIQVPPPPQALVWLQWMAWGFGYDRESDDDKVVAVAYFRDRGDRRWALWIYSVKTSCWKSIDDFPWFYLVGHGVFFNGALHWIASDYGGDLPVFIFALNLGNLEYHSLPLPSDYAYHMCQLGVVDGCLFAISSENLDNLYELWVMKEYGVKESWTRLGTYKDYCIHREMIFVSCTVLCEFESFWRKIAKEIRFLMDTRRTDEPWIKTLIYEPSLVCARSGI